MNCNSMTTFSAVSQNSMDVKLVPLSNIIMFWNTIYTDAQKSIKAIESIPDDLSLINNEFWKLVSVSNICRTGFSFSHISSIDNAISNMI